MERFQIQYFSDGPVGVRMADRSHRLMRPPHGTTLFGIDGLYSIPNGLVATQNGTNPPRVIRITLDPSNEPVDSKTLDAGHAAMNDISLGTMVDGWFLFIGNAGWDLFTSPGSHPAARPVTIFKTQILEGS